MPDRICTIEGCEKIVGRGGRRGWCRMHYRRWMRHRDTSIVLRGGGGNPSGPQNPHWRGDAIGYTGAHMRVRTVRGSASSLLCLCGSQAAHWAYDHTDPAEMRDDRGCPYSTDPMRYQPLCVSCHKLFDLSVLGSR